MSFQRQHGTREEIEDVILTKRRTALKSQIEKEPLNYDLWFALASLEEQATDANPSQIAEIYAEAAKNTPPTTQEKRLWKRYIYLYLNWAAFAESEN